MENEKEVRLASRFERTSLAVDILTAALIVLVSPLSFVLVLPFGVAPVMWLSAWLDHVFVLLILAIVIAVAGFGAASSYRVRAEKIRRLLKGR